MMRQFLNYLKDEDGQTSTEYILLVAVVAAIIFKFKGAAIENLFEKDGGGLVGKVFEEANTIFQ